jgi:transcriptional regulator with PAS, ATPase and Fis domain
MQPLFALLDRVIGTDLPILVQGESGTGKELIARAIHSNHPERKGPFVSINCGAVPEALLESELFGYERGAFTGAERAYDGLLVQAKGGTLFLDELGEMPLAMQVKLLRVLQEREVRPLGSPHSVSVDIRLVCATNRRLREEVARGTFREDLYYRIAGVELTIPPLRERRDDIPLLVHHHLVRAAGQLGRAVPEISADALHKLSVYPWPGNVRQLQNALTRALVMVEGDTIEASHIELPEAVVHMPRAGDRASYEQQQLKAIEDALLANNWNVAKVARSLGVSRPTLYRRMRQRGLIR